MTPKNEKFTMIPVSLVSIGFSSILDDAEFKILMFYYLKNNVQFGSSYYGYKALTTEGYYRISQNNYKRVIANLEAKKLISTEQETFKVHQIKTKGVIS